MTTQFQETNLNQFRGDRALHTFTLTSGGSAYNLTGYTITAQARYRPDAQDKIFDSAVTSGMAIADATNGSVYSTGTIVLLIPAAVTQGMPDECFYNLQAVSGSVVVTLASGKIFTIGDAAR